MKLNDFLEKLNGNPESIEFSDTMAVVEANYGFKPTEFTNGEELNEAGQNSGSCKLFAFAKLNGLDEQQTLACFGAYYREDVLMNPEGNDHGNIRNFMSSSWQGVSFKSEALSSL